MRIQALSKEDVETINSYISSIIVSMNCSEEYSEYSLPFITVVPCTDSYINEQNLTYHAHIHDHELTRLDNNIFNEARGIATVDIKRTSGGFFINKSYLLGRFILFKWYNTEKSFKDRIQRLSEKFMNEQKYELARYEIGEEKRSFDKIEEDVTDMSFFKNKPYICTLNSWNTGLYACTLIKPVPQEIARIEDMHLDDFISSFHKFFEIQCTR